MSLPYSSPDPSARHEKVADRMEQVSLNSIRKVLPDSAILEVCSAIGYVFRRRTMTPVVTVLHMILAAVWPEDSFNAAWGGPVPRPGRGRQAENIFDDDGVCCLHKIWAVIYLSDCLRWDTPGSKGPGGNGLSGKQIRSF